MTFEPLGSYFFDGDSALHWKFMQKQTYIIDFDSTLVTVESLDELARIALRGKDDGPERLRQLQALTNQGMAGKLAFDESLRRRLELFSADRGHVEELIGFLKTRLSPSAVSSKSWFETNAADIYVISGGFKDFICPVIEMLGLDPEHVYANSFLYDAAGHITGYDKRSLLCRPQGKVAQLQSLALKGKLIIIGDGYTDYEIKRHGAADEFWAMTETVARREVVDKADRVIHEFSLLA
jgi:D-3-phosphoglycerate dehydrogenase